MGGPDAAGPSVSGRFCEWGEEPCSGQRSSLTHTHKPSHSPLICQPIVKNDSESGDNSAISDNGQTEKSITPYFPFSFYYSVSTLAILSLKVRNGTERRAIKNPISFMKIHCSRLAFPFWIASVFTNPLCVLA